MLHLDFFPKILETCLDKKWSEVARQASQPTQPNPNPNHKRTGRPYVSSEPARSSTFNEVDIDFRMSGLPHSFVKQAENSRVRELVKKIESHPHRTDFQAQAHLQQSNACNPFNGKSKKMIKDMGNVELFELCETNPKVQCKECLLCRNQGIVCCTCGHLLKKVMQAEVSFNGHGIFSQFKIMSLSVQMGKDAQKDFTYRMTQDEYFRYRKNWWISLNKSGKIGPVRDRSDFNDALTTSSCFHQESGERQLRPVPFWKYQHWHPSSSSSSRWWQWSESWLSSWQLTRMSTTELM